MNIQTRRNIFNPNKLMPGRYSNRISVLSGKTTTTLASQYKEKQKWTWRSLKLWLIDSLKKFCHTTSLHGFNYITNIDFKPLERYFWLIVIILAIITSSILLTVSYIWDIEVPTVTVIENSFEPIENVRFPAVTICNFNKVSREKALRMLKMLKRPENTTEEDIELFFHSTVYYSYGVNKTTMNFKLARQLLKMNNLTLNALISELHPNCMDMISNCAFKGRGVKCDSLFQPISTVEDECCSFNYFGLKNNSFPRKIAYQIPKVPYRVTGCGYHMGLSVLLNPMVTDYYISHYSSYGFRVLLHDSYDFPDKNALTKVVTMGKENFMRIVPESTYSTENVRSMPINLRQCLFHDERKLPVMQRYSFVNCMSDCRIRYLYEKCGCITYNLPNNGSVKTCGLRELECVLDSRDIFNHAINSLNATLTRVQTTKTFPCDCLPDCQFNVYKSEITGGKMNVELSRSKTQKMNSSDAILLHVFFSDLVSTKYRRDVYQNWLNILASFGGLLGLIMGFSIITVVELLYFLTIRPIIDYVWKK